MTHTKAQAIKRAYQDWQLSRSTELRDVYGVYSHEKAQAFSNCVSLMQKHNGYGMRIVGFNTFSFSVGFIGNVDGVQSFIYITPTQRRFIHLDEL